MSNPRSFREGLCKKKVGRNIWADGFTMLLLHSLRRKHCVHLETVGVALVRKCIFRAMRVHVRCLEEIG